jgi:N-acetylneuraminate synthase
MTPHTWAEMVARTRELERALGSANKQIAENELQTVIVQRRCLRAHGHSVRRNYPTRNGDVLRPATPGAIMPYEIEAVIGTKAAIFQPVRAALDRPHQR